MSDQWRETVRVIYHELIRADALHIETRGEVLTRHIIRVIEARHGSSVLDGAGNEMRGALG